MSDELSAPDEFSAAELAAAFRRTDARGGDRGWVPPAGDARSDRTLLAAHADHTIPADPDGPLYGQLAQGLALGALASFGTGAAWNSLCDSGSSAEAVWTELDRAWGIRSPDDWFATMASMIGLKEFTGTEAMLESRTEAVARGEYAPGRFGELWRDWLAGREHDRDDYDGGTELLADIAGADEWLREHGLLAPDGYVTTIAGYTLAWSIRLIRCGVQTGLGEPSEAAQMVLTVRDSAARIFASWTEFAVSAIAGTLIHDAVDRDDVLRCAATLLTRDHSPWRALPFPLGDLSPDAVTD